MAAQLRTAQHDRYYQYCYKALVVQELSNINNAALMEIMNRLSDHLLPSTEPPLKGWRDQPVEQLHRRLTQKGNGPEQRPDSSVDVIAAAAVWRLKI